MTTTSRNLRHRSISSFAIALASIAIAPLSLAANYPGKGATTFAVPSRGGQAHFLHTAVTYPVENCNDSGTGSLRDAASQAVAGDTIDLSQLTCGTLVLTSGEISVNDVVIQGPGQDHLTISGNNHDRIFFHTGTQTLTIENLTLANGYRTGVVTGAPGEDNGGGCIYSRGDVSIQYSTITRCTYSGTSPSSTAYAYGGAINAGAISLDHSSVSDNMIILEGNGYLGGSGGGISANGSADVTDSVISGNWAGASGGGIRTTDATVTNSTIANNSAAYAGGITAGPGELFITGSTISGNFSSFSVGGIYLYEYIDPIWGTGFKFSSFSLLNSTVSGNGSGTGGIAGAKIFASHGLTVSNSTIVRNTSAISGKSAGAGPYGVGLSMFRYYARPTLQNSIIAFNTSGDGLGVDASSFDSGNNQSGWSEMSGSNNLILTGSMTDGPNAIHGCPRLLPLGNYGGPTQTHALAPNSPAIDKGAATDDPYDQRGLPRTVGAAPDVGSYERQKTPADLAMRIDSLETIDAASPSCRPVTH